MQMLTLFLMCEFYVVRLWKGNKASQSELQECWIYERNRQFTTSNNGTMKKEKKRRSSTLHFVPSCLFAVISWESLLHRMHWHYLPCPPTSRTGWTCFLASVCTRPRFHLQAAGWILDYSTRLGRGEEKPPFASLVSNAPKENIFTFSFFQVLWNRIDCCRLENLASRFLFM